MAREQKPCSHLIRGTLYELQTKPPEGLGIERECERADCGAMLRTFKNTPNLCDRRKDHVVHPTQWPLRPRRGTVDDVPSAALPCDNCGATVIIYNGEQPDMVTVIDPKSKKPVAEKVAAAS